LNVTYFRLTFDKAALCEADFRITDYLLIKQDTDEIDKIIKGISAGKDFHCLQGRQIQRFISI